MLSKPYAGWTEFQLEGCGAYALSYLDDIAFEWVEQAIHGLETMLPFCVKGFLEPNRMLCTVSYWNCHIVVEDDERAPLENANNEYSHTSMLKFCKSLYNDVSACAEDWAEFVDYQDSESIDVKTARLNEMLEKLKELILKREEWFGDNRCFL